MLLFGCFFLDVGQVGDMAVLSQLVEFLFVTVHSLSQSFHLFLEVAFLSLPFPSFEDQRAGRCPAVSMCFLVFSGKDTNLLELIHCVSWHFGVTTSNPTESAAVQSVGSIPVACLAVELLDDVGSGSDGTGGCSDNADEGSNGVGRGSADVGRGSDGVC